MKIKRTREHRFNMGQYEHVITAATVEIDTDELPEGTDPVATANDLLDDVLREDVDRADETSTTPEADTYLHAWKDISDGT